MSGPEAWLRGPVEGVSAELQPAAHSLLQSLHIFARALEPLDRDAVNAKVGTAATISFHTRHAAGSIDRMLTYARGEMLSEQQRSAKDDESESWSGDGASLSALVCGAIERALEVIRNTDPATLQHVRMVGSKQLPSTVGGLLFHIAEHTLMHGGQIRTTIRAMERDA